jgi:glycosyltransferase involved in cell wall biosynthesis
MRIAIVTDAWRPQINGVVRTLESVAAVLERQGVEVDFIGPQDFRTLPLPSYPDIRIALTTPSEVGRRLESASTNRIHIATEGPLGILARRYCLARQLAFTTSYHTRFPEYLRARLPIPLTWSYAWLRRFHNSGSGVLVAAPSLRSELTCRGFRNIQPWTRGVDTLLFHPQRRRDLGFARPVFLSVGRVAVEKNLSAFLDLDLPGSKVVVGDGPDLHRLRRRHPAVHFLGVRTGEPLAEIYASSDVFVFPSRTDTFGNVILEALSSGCPVAAFPVTGPLDIIGANRGGALSEDFRTACLGALAASRAEARDHALAYGWDDCAKQFLDHVRNAGSSVAAARHEAAVPC